MKKIIGVSTDSSKEKLFNCIRCKTVFLADKEDYQMYITGNYPTIYTSRCPRCRTLCGEARFDNYGN